MLFWFSPAAVTVTVGHAHEDQQEDQEEEDEARHCVHHGRGEGDRDVGEAWGRHPPSVPGASGQVSSVGVTTVCVWVREMSVGQEDEASRLPPTLAGGRSLCDWVSVAREWLHTPPSSLPLTHLLYAHTHIINHIILIDPNTVAVNLILWYTILYAWMVKYCKLHCDHITMSLIWCHWWGHRRRDRRGCLALGQEIITLISIRIKPSTFWHKEVRIDPEFLAKYWKNNLELYSFSWITLYVFTWRMPRIHVNTNKDWVIDILYIQAWPLLGFCWWVQQRSQDLDIWAWYHD